MLRSRPRSLRRVLVVYRYLWEVPLRASTRDHLYCFNASPRFEAYYINLAVRRVPRSIQKTTFDMVVFHKPFAEVRWCSDRDYQRTLRRARDLARLSPVRVLVPQDEHSHTDRLEEMIHTLGIQHVLSLAPEQTWGTLYPGVDREKVGFRGVLPGYLGRRTLSRIAYLAQREGQRRIDIGYRAGPGVPAHGRHGMLKTRIAEEVCRRAREFGLTVDISTRPEDVLLGDAWLAFLLRCRWVIGVEGGASILDRDGSVRAGVERYLLQHPRATYEEIEAKLFPDRDGELRYAAVSPRHLEACATRTGQILVRGSYSGVLRSGAHYVPVRDDFADLDEALARVADEEARRKLVERAHSDIVESRAWTYDRLLELFPAGPAAGPASSPGSRDRTARVRWRRARLADQVSWLPVALHYFLARPVRNAAGRALLRAIGPEALQRLEDRFRPEE